MYPCTEGMTPKAKTEKVDNMGRVIKNTKIVYLDYEKYVRVFFKDSIYFEDVRADIFEKWKEATGNYEIKGTPSQQCKEAGLKSLSQVAKMTGQSLQTLSNWSKKKPELFKIVLIGCKAKLGA